MSQLLTLNYMDRIMRNFKEEVKEIIELAESEGVELSLVVKELSGKGAFTYAADRIHSSASIIKIPIMMAVLEDLDLSTYIKLSDENRVDFSVVSEMGYEGYSLEEYLLWMMMESCNASTNVLIDLVGFDRVNRIFKDLGMKDTVLARKMMDTKARKEGRDNFTSAQDMAILMESLYRGSYFKKETCEKGLEIMKRCRSYDLLPRYLVETGEFAHKTGGLNEVSHDVGIFFGKEDILVCALTTSESDSENDPRRTRLLGLLGRSLMKKEFL